MAAALTDKFQYVGNEGTLTSLQSPGKALAASSITIGSGSNWPSASGFVLAIRTVDSSGVEIANTYTEWLATYSGSGTSVTINPVPVAGSDQVYTAGTSTQVFIPVSAKRNNLMVDGILSFANQDGTLKSSPVVTAIAGQAIAPASLPNAFITPNMLKLLPQANTVATSQATTSTSFADLTTTGPAVTVTIGANGFALVILSAEIVSATDAIGRVSFTASGANTIAAADANSVAVKVVSGAADLTASNIITLTSLTAGSTTFTCKYKTTSGTATFANRSITVIPL